MTLKVVYSGELNDISANYDILGLEVKYKFDENIKFIMKELLFGKLTKLEVPIVSMRSSKTLSPPDNYIQSETIDTNGDNYYKDVNWLQRTVAL